jgi:hypothetical protein
MAQSDIYLNSKGRDILTFSGYDTLTRPNNTTAYAANKSVNCDLTVTAGSYSGRAVTLTSAAHGLAAKDRITVAGINTGFTWTDVDGNWVITSVTTNTITFSVTTVPTGTASVTATVTHAIMKQMSIEVAGTSQGGIILSRLSLACQGVAMTGAFRVYVYTAQTTVAYDQAAFTILTANDTYRRDYWDFYPITEGTGSDGTFASVRLWETFQCAAGDNRLYFRVAAEGASTPVASAVLTLRATGIQLLK